MNTDTEKPAAIPEMLKRMLTNPFERRPTRQKRERVKRGFTKRVPNEKKSKTLRKMQAKSRKINRAGK